MPGLRALLRMSKGKTLKRFPVRVPTGSPVHRLSAVTIVRNEADALAEWIDFHQAQGISHFYIYDNESTDGTRSLLQHYADKDVATVIPWVHRRGYHTQARAFAHALATFGPHSQWIGFFDIDEFMFCPGGQPLPAFLAQFAHRPALIVHRHTFGTSGHETPPGRVTANFVWRLPAPEGPFLMQGNLAPKSIVQPGCVAAANGAHTFILKGTSLVGYDEADEPLTARQAPAFRASRIRINHYYTKDNQTFLRRITHGRTASNIVVPEARWQELLKAVEAAAIIHDDSICRDCTCSASRDRKAS